MLKLEISVQPKVFKQTLDAIKHDLQKHCMHLTVIEKEDTLSILTVEKKRYYLQFKITKMKKLLIIFALVPMLFGCCSLQNDNSEQNIALVEKYIQSVESLDYQTMESLLDDSYYGFGPSYGDSINKEQAVLNWKYNVENLYKSIKYNKSRNAAVTITTSDNQGEWVSNWGELHIVYKDDEHVTLWANTTYKIENSKIIKSYTFYNEADALEQLGYVFINTNDL